MALTYEVKSKKVKILSEAGGTFLDQDFDPTKPGFESFESNSAAEAWAVAFIAQVEAEAAEKAAKEEATKAAYAAEEAALLAEREAEAAALEAPQE